MQHKDQVGLIELAAGLVLAVVLGVSLFAFNYSRSHRPLETNPAQTLPDPTRSRHPALPEELPDDYLTWYPPTPTPTPEEWQPDKQPTSQTQINPPKNQSEKSVLSEVGDAVTSFAADVGDTFSSWFNLSSQQDQPSYEPQQYDSSPEQTQNANSTSQLDTNTTEATPTPRLLGRLIPRSVNEMEDASHGNYATFDARGGVLSTEFPDGTKAYLIFPLDAFVLPKIISLAPLSTNPFTNYPVEGKSYGVSIGSVGDIYTHKDSWLVFDMRADKALPNELIDRLSWCRFEFKYFNPILCASEQNVPLGFGVDAGKVVFGYKYEDDYDLEFLETDLLYTYPVGNPKVVVAKIHRSGAYFFDEVSAKLATELAQITLEKTSQFKHRLTGIAQITANGSVTNQVKDFLNRYKHSTLVQREALQYTNIAAFAKEKELSKYGLEQFNREFDAISQGVRAYDLTWAQQVALARLFNLSLNQEEFKGASSLSPQPQPDDRRLVQAVETIIREQEQQSTVDPDRLAYAEIAYLETLREPSSLAQETENLLFPAAHAKEEKKPLVDMLGDIDIHEKAIQTAKNECDYDWLQLLMKIFLDPKSGFSQSRISSYTDFISDAVKECLEQDLEKAGSWESASGVVHWADVFGENNIKLRAKTKADILPIAAIECDFVDKNLSNFGRNECQ